MILLHVFIIYLCHIFATWAYSKDLLQVIDKHSVCSFTLRSLQRKRNPTLWQRAENFLQISTNPHYWLFMLQNEVPVVFQMRQRHWLRNITVLLLAHSVYIPVHVQKAFPMGVCFTLEILQLLFSVHLLHVLQHHPNPLLTYSAASLFVMFSLLSSPAYSCCCILNTVFYNFKNSLVFGGQKQKAKASKSAVTWIY